MSRFWEIVFCVPLLFRRHVCLSNLKHSPSRELPLTGRKTVFSHLKLSSILHFLLLVPKWWHESSWNERFTWPGSASFQLCLRWLLQSLVQNQARGNTDTTLRWRKTKLSGIEWILVNVIHRYVYLSIFTFCFNQDRIFPICSLSAIPLSKIFCFLPILFELYPSLLSIPP